VQCSSVEVVAAGVFSGLSLFRFSGRVKTSRNQFLSVYGCLRSQIVIYDKNLYRLSNWRSNSCPLLLIEFSLFFSVVVVRTEVLFNINYK